MPIHYAEYSQLSHGICYRHRLFYLNSVNSHTSPCGKYHQRFDRRLQLQDDKTFGLFQESLFPS